MEQKPANVQHQLPPGVNVTKDIEYARASGLSLKLDIYSKAGTEEPQPVVVWIHGGAWRGGSKSNSPAAYLANRGYIVVSIDYRLSGQATFPAQIHDCKAAIRWIRTNAKRYNFDPNRIAVWGGSAGGHLAALLGTSIGDKTLEGDIGNNLDHSSTVQAVCDWYGPTDFLQMEAGLAGKGNLRHDAPDSPEAKLIGGPVQQNKDKCALANPITYITPGKTLPLFLIMHGSEDLTVPLNQSELLHAALKRAGAAVEFHILRGARHGFSRDELGREARQQLVAAFFDKHLKPQPAPARPRRSFTADTQKWLDIPAPATLPPRVQHKTYHSAAMNVDCGYLIYLPPGYETSALRYPIYYWLHGLGGTELRYPALAEKLDRAIAAGVCPPMVLVMPNGGQGAFYCDSADGKVLVETMILKDLMPHVEQTYRVIPGPRGRILDGCSMGGFGALHLAFKYPELFTTVSASAAALIGEEDFRSNHPDIYRMMFNADPQRVIDSDPFTLLKRNADRIRRHTQVTLFVGTADKFCVPNQRLTQLLDDLRMPCQLLTLEAIGHNRPALYNAFFEQVLLRHLERIDRPRSD